MNHHSLGSGRPGNQHLSISFYSHLVASPAQFSPSKTVPVWSLAEAIPIYQSLCSPEDSHEFAPSQALSLHGTPKTSRSICRGRSCAYPRAATRAAPTPTTTCCGCDDLDSYPRIRWLPSSLDASSVIILIHLFGLSSNIQLVIPSANLFSLLSSPCLREARTQAIPQWMTTNEIGRRRYRRV